MKKIVLVFAMIALVTFSIYAQTSRTAIATAKLPKEITDYVKSHYQICNIIKAESVTEKQVFTYIISIACNDKKVNVIFDKDKKFIKEDLIKDNVVKLPKPGESQPPVTTQPVKTEPAKNDSKSVTSPTK